MSNNITGDELLDRVSAAICEARNKWMSRDLEGDQPDFDDALARAALAAIEANPILPKAAEKPAPRKDWHYDSQGYCDNPGRGY